MKYIPSFFIIGTICWASYESYTRFNGKFLATLEFIWPLLILFAVFVLLLLPSVMYIFSLKSNLEIKNAIRQKDEAEEQARQAKFNAYDEIHAFKEHAEKAIQYANEQQRAICLNELETERWELNQLWQQYHRTNNAIVKKENELRNKEIEAKRKIDEANKLVDYSKQQIAVYEKKAKNATAAFHRIKKKNTSYSTSRI